MRSKNPDMMDAIVECVNRYHLRNYHSPTLAEIADELGIVRSTVYKYLVEMNARGMISYDGREIETAVTRKVRHETTSAAILGSIACGLPQYAEENIEEYVSLPVSMFGRGEFYILRASGESMIDAGIDSGDLVVIRKQNCADEGDIVVALVENETTLKRFYKDKRRKMIRLHPENKDMADIYVRECAIQGVAVHVIKALT
jgi:repressor LexA